MTNRIARPLAKALTVRVHSCLDRVGLHVLPKHYYTPVPDRQWLFRNRPLWNGRADLTGVEWDLDGQMRWLREIAGPHYGEVKGLRQYQSLVCGDFGPGYGAIESQVLHGFIRSKRPRRIVEVGSGVSTACMVDAFRRNAREGDSWPETVCIEPYPRPALLSLEGVSVLRTMAQAAPLEAFTRLGRGDFLFIDSSHAVKTGSDVLRLYLDVIPRLEPGVTIHIHDIFLPYLYQPDVLDSLFYWQETALLLALLKGNRHLRTLCCLSALHYDRTGELRDPLTDYRPRAASEEGLAAPDGDGYFPASIFLETR